jgi:hypothetical protein
MSFLPSNVFWGFIVFDPNTQLPIYSQYTFNFDLYSNDFELVGKTKNEIFRDFWIRNQNDFEKPYTVLPELQKYFNPMTQQIIDYMYFYGFAAHWGRLTNIEPPGFIPPSILVEQQFDLIYYTPKELGRVEDYFFQNEFGIFTKYNFIFDEYIKDFQVYGPKLLIFTQFVSRNQMTSGVIYDGNTYGLNLKFLKYFDTSERYDIVPYLVDFSCCSAFPTSEKNVDIINWVAYSIDNKLFLPVEEAKQQWYSFGQFERRIVKFFPPPVNELEKVRNSTCQVHADLIGSGFRVENPTDQAGFYLLTALHIFTDPNTQLFLGTFSFIQENGIIDIITAQFRLIGFDSLYDMVLGKFEPELPFNVANNVTNLDFIKPITLDLYQRPLLDDPIFMFGTFAENGVSTITAGVVLSTNYTGPFSYDINDSKYILSQNTIGRGMAGGPQFVKDPLTNTYLCKAMTIKAIPNLPNVSVGIVTDLLYDFIARAVKLFDFYVIKYADDLSSILRLLDQGFRKSWLGIVGRYYDKNDFNQYKKLSNLDYTGGFIVDNFIQGFDYEKQEFVYNSFQLNDLHVIKIVTPLLNSPVQDRFNNSDAPIVITKLCYWDSVYGNFIEYPVGKYDGQQSLYRFTTGFQPVGDYATLDPNFIDNTIYQYPQVKITYFYYDGTVWKEQVDFIGSNDPSWYETFTNFSNINTTINRFQLPPFLVIYLSNIYQSIFNGNANIDLFL